MSHNKIKDYKMLETNSLPLTKEDLNGFAHKPRTVTFLCGLPNSGKTTYRKEHLQDDIIISFDDLILKIFKTTNYNEAYSHYRSSSDAMKHLIKIESQKRFLTAILELKNVTLDFTNVRREFIKTFYNFIPSHYHKNLIVFDVDIETIMERNEKRENKFVPVEVLRKMEADFREQEYLLIVWDNCEYAHRIQDWEYAN